jgi:uroporphyrinogen III methyltransferase / synthase
LTTARPPLAGLTVLVPRARDQAGDFSALLRARGAEPLEVPTIEIRAVASTAELDRAVEDLAAGRFAWVVLTSVNGVAAVRARVEALGRGPTAVARAKVAAVGPATEAALRAWGIVPDLVPEAATTAALGQAFPPRPGGAPGAGAVLLARADLANPELGVLLRGKGWETTEVVAYHTVPVGTLDPAARRRLDLGEVDWVAFTASSTVEGFLRGYGGPPPPGVRVAAIGPVTADTARSAGIRVATTATEHTVPGLVAAIEHAVSP